MMIGPLARFLLAATAAAFLPTSLGRAEEGQVWLSKSNGSLVTLAYGPVDSAKPPFFLLSCFNGMEVAVLDLHQEGGAKPGDKVAIEITAGGAKASLEGETSRDEASGLTVAEASDIKVKPVLTVLNEKGPVTVKAGETSTSLGEQGRAEAVASFAADCKLD